ncbi:hypothetical protein C0989_001583 [Termitomyces sp. Mn162]|nr:hypothetical protein C0989_001583 [Termitomyces sp. Mn162]
MATFTQLNSTPNADIIAPEIEPDQAEPEIDTPKTPDPFRVADLAIEVAIERTRTNEALKARDATVQRLVEAHESIRQKSATIELLQQNIKSRASSPFIPDSSTATDRTETTKMKEEIARLERTIVELRIEIRTLKENAAKTLENQNNMDLRGSTPQLLPLRCFESPAPSQSSQNSVGQTGTNSTSDPFIERPASHYPVSDEPADMVTARNAVLADLPLPQDATEETLSPLSIPSPLTIQEFISTLSGPLRTSLNQYRLFYAITTMWCPEREEHGYFYTPAFKCSTNPRVATAHRWSPVDIIGRMNKPTECFFNKDGTWYYAGVYTAFRLADLTTKEWAALPTEVTQLIVKETIVARKNTSPQNIYEVSQLYAAGALKVACVALQCIGFNNAMYRALLEQARVFTQSKWAAATGKASPVPTSVPGLGSGSVWNVNANLAPGIPVQGGATGGQGDVVTGMAAMNLGRRSQNENRNENMPTPIGEGRKR